MPALQADRYRAVLVARDIASPAELKANAGRLRLKESDRIESTLSLLRSIGAKAWCEGDEIHISGTGGRKLPGGTVDSFADHRIAMTASCAAAICTGPVTVTGAQCVAKSYPGFYEDLPKLGLEEGDQK